MQRRSRSSALIILKDAKRSAVHQQFSLSRAGPLGQPERAKFDHKPPPHGGPSRPALPKIRIAGGPRQGSTEISEALENRQPFGRFFGGVLTAALLNRQLSPERWGSGRRSLSSESNSLFENSAGPRPCRSYK